MPALQLVIVKHKDTFSPEQVSRELTKELQSVPGVQCTYAGAALDAENKLVVAVIWNEYASSLGFVKSEQYESYFSKLREVSAEPVSTSHCLVARPKEQLQKLCDAPALEMAPIRLKGDRVYQHYRNFEKAGRMIAQAKGNVAQFQQPQIESPYVQWSLVGWQSIDLHLAFQQTPEFPDFLALVAPNVDMPGPPPIIHAHLEVVFGRLE